MSKYPIVNVDKILALIGDWKGYLLEAHHMTKFEEKGRTGRALGNEIFIEKAEELLKRNLNKKQPVPKPRDN